MAPNTMACQIVTENWTDFWNAAVSYWNWDIVLREYNATGKVTDVDTPTYLAQDLRDDWADVQEQLGKIPDATTGVMQEVRDLMLSYTSNEYAFIDEMKASLDIFKKEEKKINAYCS